MKVQTVYEGQIVQAEACCHIPSWIVDTQSRPAMRGKTLEFIAHHSRKHVGMVAVQLDNGNYIERHDSKLDPVESDPVRDLFVALGRVGQLRYEARNRLFYKLVDAGRIGADSFDTFHFVLNRGGKDRRPRRKS